jgi:hypothetical protein|tara:strand:- start:1005 stop:1586 length:582 start_codon:yes stop_codon:yes gene_type:complete
MDDLPKPPQPKSVEERMKTPMSNSDLEKHTGIKEADIILYSNLRNYSKIEELLPDDKSARIILMEEKPQSGHWVALMRYGKTIEYFNSYGNAPDCDWGFVSRMMRMILGQNGNDLTRLMKQAEKDGFETVWNKKKLQKLSPNIQTCGRWDIFRIETMRMGYTLPEFYTLLKKLKAENPESGGSYDWIVSKYVA